jgi:hypothetical protein
VLHSDRAVATTENGQTDRQREQRNEQRDKRWLHRVIGTQGDWYSVATLMAHAVSSSRPLLRQRGVL